jgi:hypothetical protein
VKSYEFLFEGAIPKRDWQSNTLFSKVGQSGQTKEPTFTVLWYWNPRMGFRFLDHPGIGAEYTHAEWMNQEGINAKEFPKLPRGRFHVNRPEKTVTEFRHIGKITPPEVYKYFKRVYKIPRDYTLLVHLENKEYGFLSAKDQRTADYLNYD